MTCEDKDSLVAYLFDEATPDARRQVEGHLAACEACRKEIEDLGHVRVGLRAWSPPEARLGFRVVRDGRAPVSPPLYRSLAVWGLAAAAVLVLAAGAALANLEIRYGADGFTVRTGWAAGADVAADSAAVQARPVAGNVPGEAGAPARVDADWRAQMDALERRLRTEFTSALAARGAPAALPSPSRSQAVTRGPSEAELLRRIQALIEESEQRQQRELARRVAQVINEVDAQRRADLLRIEQGLGQLEGLTGAEVARQRDMLNYLMRVSQR